MYLLQSNSCFLGCLKLISTLAIPSNTVYQYYKEHHRHCFRQDNVAVIDINNNSNVLTLGRL